MKGDDERRNWERKIRRERRNRERLQRLYGEYLRRPEIDAALPKLLLWDDFD